MSLTRYTAPIPEGAKVVETREQLNQAARQNPQTVLYDQDGGYMLKDEDGTVVAVAADSLCPELDQAVAEVEAKQAQEKLAGTTGDPGETKRDVNDDLGANRPLRCSHPRCFNSAICLTYTDCHVCLRHNHCI
ncbi:uncharacterized protein BO80DRAFT_463544 [Aspergillus ibericus CBS 121593]|uniref:Uncharacterized protein n=1 Tax=Aspergillus ibericus CBS 121593 TaxID=1448316 RepID=A0A395H346_9EURO|nr:hypothetical protein BO80DRAFT_463544 [Aspergillus ibericus CBS 121593]RAL02317.1 hypothetical protein BO80DRAFT_463544 [Aspergillus ibericus CBS 121593]